MAVAAVIKARDVTTLKRIFAELTFSGTYTTGGEAPTAGFLKSFDMTEVVKCNLDQGTVGTTDGVIAKYNYSTNKVMLFRPDQVDDQLEELPNATAIAQVLRAEFVGRGNN